MRAEKFLMDSPLYTLEGDGDVDEAQRESRNLLRNPIPEKMVQHAAEIMPLLLLRRRGHGKPICNLATW